MARTSSTTARFPAVSRRFRAASRAIWLAARARNVMHRRRRLAGVGVGGFLVVLVSYLVFPAGVRGVLNLVSPGRLEWRDTTALLQRTEQSRVLLAEADRVLEGARARRAAALAPPTPGLSPSAVAVRDSLARAAGALGALIQRAESAPLSQSYRALSESPLLRDDPRVRALADSLGEVEQERDALGGGATVDPIFVALTTQANSLGRSIQGIAEQRVAALKRGISAIESSPQPVAVIDSNSPSLPDTAAAANVRQRAAVALATAERAVVVARSANALADSTRDRERARTQLAPLSVLVIGALIISFTLAFALALIDEIRSPRVADVAEAERLTNLRVLTIARLRPLPAERARRASDRAIPPLVDPTFDAYRVLAWHLTAQWPKDGIMTITGDEPFVVGTVAANLAAILANDARITLLIDADFVHEPMRGVLELPRTPGLAAVLENRRKWSESLIPVPVGRSRTLDVLPSGSRSALPGPAESEALIGEIRRAARRHDATVVVTSLAGARRIRAGDDVVVCAMRSRTRLATLARTVATLIDEGARVRGVVLWDSVLPTPKHARRERGPLPAATPAFAGA